MTEKRLAYLGPEGSYTEEAAIAYNSEAERISCVPIHAVALAVDSGEADEGVVPIENSLGGSVTETLDLLIRESTLFIRNELVLPIKHSFLVAEGTKASDISIILSKPEAFAQCRIYLNRHYPKSELVASLSTSTAVKEMLKRGPNAAAIANRRAGELFGAKVLAEGIEDSANNVTRFVVLGPTDHSPTGQDKTSICFSFDDDIPGLLYRVMGEFANRNINLAKIESRPTRQNLGRYIFLLDVEGHRLEQRIRQAIEGVKSHVSMLRIFGSYPRYLASNRV